jgi:hypothetical protein
VASGAANLTAGEVQNANFPFRLPLVVNPKGINNLQKSPEVAYHGPPPIFFTGFNTFPWESVSI